MNLKKHVLPALFFVWLVQFQPALCDEPLTVVGGYVQLERGNFRIAWAPVFGELEATGAPDNPDCEVKFNIPGTAGVDRWLTGEKEKNWLHLGPLHAIKEEYTENGKKWTVCRVLHWDGKEFAGIYYAECPADSYRGLTVWKGLSTEWSLVVEAVRRAGYLDAVNGANLFERARQAVLKPSKR